MRFLAPLPRGPAGGATAPVIIVFAARTLRQKASASGTCQFKPLGKIAGYTAILDIVAPHAITSVTSQCVSGDTNFRFRAAILRLRWSRVRWRSSSASREAQMTEVNCPAQGHHYQLPSEPKAGRRPRRARRCMNGGKYGTANGVDRQRRIRADAS